MQEQDCQIFVFWTAKAIDQKYKIFDHLQVTSKFTVNKTFDDDEKRKSVYRSSAFSILVCQVSNGVDLSWVTCQIQ